MAGADQRKVALVTGASSGIGRAAAEAFVARGYATALVDRNDDAGREVEAQLRGSGECVFIRCDVTDDAGVRLAVDEAVARYGRLDAAFNAAGIDGEHCVTGDASLENWNRVIAVNLTGVFSCMRYEIPQMLKSGGGSIVNCASVAGLVGAPFVSAYAASKHGVVGLTKAAALEYAARGVRVNAVCPGMIDTPMSRANMTPEVLEALVAESAIGRLGQPEEIAAAAVWLCEDAPGFLTGQAIAVDGAWTCAVSARERAMQGTEPPSTVPALLAAVVAARGAQDAIAMAQETLSYDELDRRTARMARALLALGAGKGARIALMAPDGVLWITTFLAGLRIGALMSVVSTLCTPPELAHILRNSDVQIFIGARRFLRHDYAATLSAALPGLDEGRAEALRIPSAPYLRSVWLDDAEDLGWAGAIDDLLARADGPDAPDAALLGSVEREVGPSDEAVIVYTSGSTSAPKAVVHTQANVTRHPRELADYFLLKPGDRMLPQLPAFWLGGMVMAMEVLSVGATLVYPASPDIEVVADTIEQLAVNRVNGWGDGLTRLRKAATARGVEVDKIVGLGPFRDPQGELIPPQLQVNMLGMSETFAAHSAERLDFRLPEDKAGASGRTVGGYERRVVDPETGAEVPLGQVGELQLRGGALMAGLYKVDRRKVFTADGFYPTGDLVRLDADGYLYFVARRGDMIKTKAANVSRLEVEAALLALPGVELPIVVGLPDPDLGQMVAAAVVPAPGAAPTEESLRAALRETLSSYKVPRSIVFISHDDVPRTATGKLKLFELADMIAQRIGKAR